MTQRPRNCWLGLKRLRVGVRAAAEQIQYRCSNGSQAASLVARRWMPSSPWRFHCSHLAMQSSAVPANGKQGTADIARVCTRQTSNGANPKTAFDVVQLTLPTRNCHHSTSASSDVCILVNARMRRSNVVRKTSKIWSAVSSQMEVRFIKFVDVTLTPLR